MRTTIFAHDLVRQATMIPLAAAAGLLLTACGGGSDTAAETPRETPVTPVVATSVSSGESSAPVRPDYSDVTYETAEATYFARRYEEASAMFSAYTERRPENPWGHYMLGLSAWKSGDLGGARSALERSLELDPTHVKTLLNLARVLLEQDRAGEAKERVQAALALDTTSAEVHRVLGRVHTALGEPDEAIDVYRVALTLDPGDAWSMNNLALIRIHQERYEEAVGPLARAVQLRPGAPVFQNNLGIALERTGQVGAARDAYRAALAADSTYRKAQASLARLEGVVDDPTIVPVKLSVLADAFEREVQRWREEQKAVVPPSPVGIAEMSGSVTIVPDSVLVPEHVPPR